MNKKPVRLLIALFILVLGCPLAWAQTPSFMSVDEIRPGMKGVGRTVFEGTKIEEFQVEILGVLKNFAPKLDMVLARLSGGPIAHTGVIQGMSGSPVYIDGRLVGAVAYSFPFSKDPIAGIQPIAQMVNILDAAPSTPLPVVPAAPPAESPAAFIQGVMDKVAQGKSMQEIFLPAMTPSSTAGASLARIQTPLFVSGISTAASQQFGAFFNSMGFSPVQSGGTGSSANMNSVPSRVLEPGSPVNAELIRGDISVTANGTVTYVDGNKVYAFGHPFMSAGPTALPMSNSYVISVLPRLDSSFKLAVPVDVIGAFQQDRSTGILGSMGQQPSMIPVSLTVKSSLNNTNQYNFEVANDRFLTPLLMNFSLFSGITASERGLGEMTLNVSGTVHLKDYDPVRIANVFTGDANGPTTASVGAVAPIQYLMANGDYGSMIERVELEIVSTDRKASATLERVSVDRSEVRPGETVTLTAYLRSATGETFIERYPVQIPTGLAGGAVQLQVGDGTTITNGELRRGASGAPADLKAAIRELNKLRKNDRLYIKIVSNEPGMVIAGEELPSLPPSLVAVLDTDRASSRSVVATGNSTLSEYELPQSKYVIQGQRSLTLAVRP